jgi:hypothetical protein
MSARRFFSHQDGAAAVEMGILLLPLMLILFGILDYGIAFNRQMNGTHQVREAARAAAALETPPSYADVSVSRCTKDNTTGYVLAEWNPPTYQPVFGMLPSLELGAEARMRCEGVLK